MITNRDGEVTEAWSLYSCIYCRLTEATVCKPRSSVHALFVGSILVTKHAENEVSQLATVCGTFLDVAAGSPRDDLQGCRFVLLGSDLFLSCSEVGYALPDN